MVSKSRSTMDYFEIQAFITTEIAKYFTDAYSWSDRLMAPINSAIFMIKLSLMIYSEMINSWFFSSVVIAIIVHLQNLFKDYMAMKFQFKTLVGVHNKNRKFFNLSKIVFWAIFAPIYPLYLVVSKSIVYIPAFYALPFYLVKYMIFKNNPVNRVKLA